MQTLWNKGIEASAMVEEFTVGNDRVLDMELAKYDVIGSKAHIAMLKSIGLLSTEEESKLQHGLSEILEEIEKGEFVLGEEAEDIHSQVELTLTKRYGEIGKKIHAGRSRNDQVLVDIKLYLRERLEDMRDGIMALFERFQSLSEKYSTVLLPGYTHMQLAMPSSFGLWFGAYAETLVDDMQMLKAAYRIVNQNPLGTAAGYGSSFPLDREMTTRLLGFETLHYNAVAAHISRGKSERSVAAAIASLASTLNKFAADCCLYMCTNFKFISFPDELTTGSSIMPHKKNPDVWEILRGRTNRLQSIQTELALLTTNMPHGYHRDNQLLKDILFPAFSSMSQCVEMTCYMLDNIKVNEDIMKQPGYEAMFSVEAVNNLVIAGVPFRDAYKEVGMKVKEGSFNYIVPEKVDELKHTHIGSIGNLCNAEIAAKMQKASCLKDHTTPSAE
ncbi:MAG: argininosuccinate lyase [Bacteroidales bacterium]|nr:argininosuccinate lyase [Bacteroidales bacterium]